MTRKKWLWLVAAALAVLGIGAGAAVLGIDLYRSQKQQEYLAKAEALYQQENWLLARRTYALYLKQRPDNADVLAKYAEACLRLFEGREEALGEAARAYILLTQLRPDDIAAQEKLLDIQTKLGAWGDVEYYAHAFLGRRPDDPALQNIRARALMRLGRREEATEALRTLVDAGTAEPRSYLDLALLLRERQLDSQARAVLETALRQHPESASIRAQRAQYAIAARDMAMAETEVTEGLRLEPSNPDALLAAMRFEMARGAWDKAQELGEKIIQLAPERSETYIPLAETYSRQGSIAKAIDFLSALSPEISVDSPAILVALTDLQLSCGQIDAARATNQKLLKAHPANVLLQDYFRGRMLLLEGKPQEAASILETVVVRDPSFAPSHVYLALANLDLRRPDQARIILETYLRNTPNDENARALLQRIARPPRTAEEFAQEAQTLQRNELATSRMLIAAAKSLYEVARNENAVPAYLPTMQTTIEKAIAMDPKSAQGYLALQDLATATDDLEGAAAALDRAAAAGIAEDVLRMPRAGLALARGDVEAAHGLCKADIAREDVTARELIDWASFFAEANHPEIAMETLGSGKPGFSAEDQRAIAAARVKTVARQGKPEEARALLETLGAGGAPEVTEARVAVAQAFLKTGAPEAHARAQEALDAALKEDPENLAAQALAAQLLMTMTPPDPAGARERFQRVYDKDPANLTALLGLARLALNARDFVKGGDLADRAIALAPHSLPARLYAAEAALGQKRHSEAQRMLEALLVENPQELAALELLMTVCLETGQKARAQDLFGQIKRVAGDDPAKAKSLAYMEGRILMEQGDSAQAEKTLREQAAAHPDDATVAGNLAAMLAKTGRAAEGEDVLNRFAATHAGMLDSWLTLADFLLAQNHADALPKASTALTRAMLIDPASSSITEKMMEVQTRMGNAAEAEALCERFLKRRPEDAGMLYRKAMLMAQRGMDMAGALQTIERAIRLDPKAAYVTLRGLIFVALKQYDKGVRDLQPVAQLDSGPAHVDAAMAEAYFELGDRDAANRYYASASAKAQAGQPVDPQYLKRIGAMLGK